MKQPIENLMPILSTRVRALKMLMDHFGPGNWPAVLRMMSAGRFAADEFAQAFEAARARGYRTPHK
jgi:hypothetical protein